MGMYAKSHNRFFVTRNISITAIPPSTMPNVVTPNRIGGRVAATNSGSACRPLLALMLYPEESAYPGHNLL